MDPFIYFRTNVPNEAQARRLPKTRGSLPGLSAGGLPQDTKINIARIARTYIKTLNGPHAFGIRWVYTVPQGRQAIVDNAIVWATRVTAAAAQLTVAAIAFVKAGGQVPTLNLTANVENIQVLAQFSRILSSAGDHVASQAQQKFTLLEGDSIYGYSLDDSPGGSVAIRIDADILEFDKQPDYVISNPADIAKASSTLRRSSGFGAPIQEAADAPGGNLQMVVR